MTNQSVVSYNLIIPTNYQERLITLGNQITNICWDIGDITNTIKAGWDRVKRNDPELAVADGDIYAAVGAFCGKGARTVREYASISAFYPLEIREVYEVLSIDHFRTAMTLGPKWESALMWAIEQADNNGGRPATVDRMIAEYAVRDQPPEPPAPIESAGPQNMCEVELGSRLAEVKVVQTFVDAAGKLRTVLPSMGLNAENIKRANLLISQLLEIIADNPR